jgi:hypothetical protein
LRQDRLWKERKIVEQKRNKNVAAGEASALKRQEGGSTSVPTKRQHKSNEPILTPIKKIDSREAKGLEEEENRPHHRDTIDDLRTRGQDFLTAYDRDFFASIYGVKVLSQKRRDLLSSIAEKVLEQISKSGPSKPNEWDQKLDWARRKRQWTTELWGPMPHRKGCRVPFGLLKPEDGNGWTEHQREYHNSRKDGAGA